jgi:S1-C subfamily serine protease
VITVDNNVTYIFTNHHVADGVFWGFCEFDNGNDEETRVFPVYLDPEHDFAILRCDTSNIQYPFKALEIKPDLATIGGDPALRQRRRGEA